MQGVSRVVHQAGREAVQPPWWHTPTQATLPRRCSKRQLDEATKGCSSIDQCQKALTAELQRLAKLLSTEGTSLNKLVTRQP
jgi:hypothetical protein